MDHSQAGALGALAAKDTKRKLYLARIEAYNEHPVRCGWCQAPLPYAKRTLTYCNKSCAACQNNRHYPKRKSVQKICACGKALRSGNKWCSTCIQERRHIPHKIMSLTQTTNSSTQRRLLLVLRGHKCEVCTNTLWQGGPIPLEVDHINGDPLNNEETNLRLICPNCHALTLTYKGKNIGNGRHSRRQRYADGKSF